MDWNLSLIIISEVNSTIVFTVNGNLLPFVVGLLLCHASCILNLVSIFFSFYPVLSTPESSYKGTY